MFEIDLERLRGNSQNLYGGQAWPEVSFESLAAQVTSVERRLFQLEEQVLALLRLHQCEIKSSELFHTLFACSSVVDVDQQQQERAKGALVKAVMNCQDPELVASVETTRV